MISVAMSSFLTYISRVQSEMLVLFCQGRFCKCCSPLFTSLVIFSPSSSRPFFEETKTFDLRSSFGRSWWFFPFQNVPASTGISLSEIFFPPFYLSSHDKYKWNMKFSTIRHVLFISQRWLWGNYKTLRCVPFYIQWNFRVQRPRLVPIRLEPP